MNVTLINPSIHRNPGQRWWVPQFPTYSLMLIGTYLKQAGHTVDVYDMQADKTLPDNIPGKDADVIGFTALLPQAQGTQDCINALKSQGYKGRIVVGGYHATRYPQEVLGWGADLVVTNECDGNVVDLIESNATGIHQGELVDLGETAIVDWSIFRTTLKRFSGLGHFQSSSPVTTMWTRGCPNRCIYCDNNIFGGQLTRFRPVDHVVAEMNSLHKGGVKNVMLMDDQAIGAPSPKNWMIDICERIEGFRFNMTSLGRCSKRYITPDLMSAMKRAGFNQVFWGVESMNDEVLKNIKKNLTHEDIIHSLRVSKAAGVSNVIMVQVGQYGETPEMASITRDRIEAAHKERLIDGIRVFFTQIYDGTELCRLATEEGWHTEVDYDFAKLTPLVTPWMSADEASQWRTMYQKAAPVGTYTELKGAL